MLIFNTPDVLTDLIELGREIEVEEGVGRSEGLRRALHRWTALALDIECDARYLPAAMAVRPHVALAAGLPELEAA